MSAVISSSSRALVRRQPLVRQQLRRYADSTADKAKQTAEKAKDTASTAASTASTAASTATTKASEGLTKVSSSASSAASSAAAKASSTLNSVTGRVDRLVKLAQSMVPPTVYYSKVGLELTKMVFQGQKMNMPTVQQFQSYFTSLRSRLSNPSALVNQTVNSASKTAEQTAQTAANNPEALLQRIRNVDNATLAKGGVLFAEVLGFFTVGEMIGRLKLIGYHGEVHHEH